MWVDISGRARQSAGVTIKRGRSYELDDFQTGTCSLELDNRTLDFDTDNEIGPYSGGLLPMRQIRVLIEYAGVTYHRFYGFIEGWPQRYDISKTLAWVPVQAYDAFWLFSQSRLAEAGFIVGDSSLGVVGSSRVGGGVAGTEELSGARIDTVLELDEWPSARRDIADGQSLMAAGDASSGDPLSYMKKVEESEDGFLFVARDGAVTFLDRHARFLLDRMTTVQATFSDDGGDDGGYAEFGTDFDLDRVFNDVRFTRDGGTEQAVEDTSSRNKYRRRSSSKSGLLLTTDPETKNLARSFLNRYKEPSTRLPSIAIRPMRSPATTFPAWLDRELLDRVVIEHDPVNVGDQRVFDSLLEGYTETFNTEDFTVSANFSPRYARSPFIVGDPVAGVVGDREIVY